MTKIINEKAAEVQKAIKAKEAEIAAILWEEICEKVRPEWDNKIMNLKIITAAYKEAANALLQMEFTIKSVRNFLEKKQGGERLNSSFTFYENGDDMTIEGTYNTRIKGICNPLTSHDTI